MLCFKKIKDNRDGQLFFLTTLVFIKNEVKLTLNQAISK